MNSGNFFHKNLFLITKKQTKMALINLKHNFNSKIIFFYF